MNNKLNLTISILCIIEIICCFTPFCLNREYWKYQPSITYQGTATLEHHMDISIFGNEALLGKTLAVLFVGMAALVAVIYFVKMLGYTTKITNNAWLFSIAHTAVMAILLYYFLCIAEVDMISYKYTYDINWMSYIIIALNLIILILAMLIKMGKIENVSMKKQVIANDQKESIDDLLTYKELLTSGVISQEEFDLKKKQILS